MRSEEALRVVALLVAGAGACAAPPKPAATHAGPSEDEGEESGAGEREPACGGVIVDAPPPWTPARAAGDFSYRIAGRAEAKCGARVLSTDRFGEVRVVLRIGDHGVSAEAEPALELTRDDADCVVEAARAVALGTSAKDLSFALSGAEAFYVALGDAPPLFPSMRVLAPRWRSALQSAAARRRFQSDLPAEVQWTDEGCVTVPLRVRFERGLDNWIKGIGTPLAALWQPGDASSGNGHAPGLLAGLGGASARSDSVYWLVEGGLLIRRSLLGSSPGHEVCYRPLEGTLRTEVRARIDRAIAGCWVGNLEEILLHPRTVSCHGEPPAAMERRYVWGAE